MIFVGCEKSVWNFDLFIFISRNFINPNPTISHYYQHISHLIFISHITSYRVIDISHHIIDMDSFLYHMSYHIESLIWIHFYLTSHYFIVWLIWIHWWTFLVQKNMREKLSENWVILFLFYFNTYVSFSIFPLPSHFLSYLIYHLIYHLSSHLPSPISHLILSHISSTTIPSLISITISSNHKLCFF